jgi:hypothetical protein
VRQGHGLYRFADSGTVLSGNWKRGQLSGSAEWLFPDGTRYKGKWQGNKPHGEGAFYFKGNTQYLHYGHYKDIPFDESKKLVWEGQGFVETESS